MRLLLLVVLLGGCPRTPPDPDGPPRRLVVSERFDGPAGRGYGAAVAFVGDEVRIGAPWQGPGAVYGPDGMVLSGTDGDRLGETLLGGSTLYAGAPGRGEGGALLDGSGTEVITGAAGEALGGAPVLHGGVLVALGLSGPQGEGVEWQPDGRLWSLASVSLAAGADPVLLGGLRSGGIAWPGGSLPGPSALGRGLAGCDLDGDGDEDLVIADPLTGRVDLHVVDDLGSLDLSAPTHRHDLGPGAGRVVACLDGGVVVGAPDRLAGAAVAWLRRPLTDDPPSWVLGRTGGSFGHSLAVGSRGVLVGDPASSEVRLLVGAD